MRQEDLRGKGPVFTVAADVALQTLHDGVNPLQTEAMTRALGGLKAAANLPKLFPGGKVGKGDVQLGALHVHVHPDQPLLLRQGEACLDGVVKEVADNAAQVYFRKLQLHGDVGVGVDRNALGFCQGDFGIQDGVRHGVAGFDDGVHRAEVRVQLV